MIHANVHARIGIRRFGNPKTRTCRQGCPEQTHSLVDRSKIHDDFDAAENSMELDQFHPIREVQEDSVHA